MNKTSFLKFFEIMTLVGFGLAFFWRHDLNDATLVLMALMTLFVILVKVLGEKLTKVQFLSWLLIVVLGGATLIFQDENFIKWKSTFFYGAIGLSFLISHFFNQTLVEKILTEKINAPIPKLRRLNAAVGVYSLLVSGLNLFVAYAFSTTVWVNFKLVGLFILNMCFFTSCLIYLREYLKELIEQPPKT